MSRFQGRIQGKKFVVWFFIFLVVFSFVGIMLTYVVGSWMAPYFVEKENQRRAREAQGL